MMDNVEKFIKGLKLQLTIPRVIDQLIINIMYINIPENSKCLKCGAKNFTEMVTRNNQTFKRCRMCGHEKLYSTLTTSSNNTEPTIYNSANYNSEDVF